MNAKLPGFVTLVRRSILLGEDAEAFADLDADGPCARCPRWQQCATERTACKRFVAFVHHPDKSAWRKFGSAHPTRELYDIAMSDDAPKWATQHIDPEALRERVEGLRRTMVGQVIKGRTVVDVRTRRQFLIVVRLHCDACGRERNIDLDRVRAEKVAACICTHAKQLADRSRERTAARYLGKTYKNDWECVRVESGALSRTGRPRGTILILRHASGVMVRRDAHHVSIGQGLAPPGDRYCRGSWRE